MRHRLLFVLTILASASLACGSDEGSAPIVAGDGDGSADASVSDGARADGRGADAGVTDAGGTEGGDAGGAAFGHGAALSPYLVGQNFWYPSSVSSLWPVVKASGVALMRIGGNAPNKTPPSEAQLADWVAQVRAIGAEPVVQVSQASTDAQAGALVTALNVTRRLGVRYWNIGNEPDLDKVPVADVGTYVRGHASAMKAADPTIRIFAPDLASYNEAYLGPLVGGAEDVTGKDANGRFYVDGVTFHTYPHGATYTRADVVGSAAGLRANVAKLRAALAAADAKHGRSGATKLAWALGEFNLTYANPAANDVGDLGVTSFINGQFFAEVFAVAMEAGAEYAATWSVQEADGGRGTADLGYLDGPVATAKPRSSYWHLQLVAQRFHGRYAPATSTQPNVKAFGAGDGDTLAVMILNEDAATKYTFSLALGAAKPAPDAGAVTLHVDSELAATFTGSIDAQATAVLLFDRGGAMVKRIDYMIADAMAWKGPH